MTNHPHYHRLGSGGSFDHFHKGHQAFLRQGAAQTDKLLVGITTDAMLRRKTYPESLESYDTRYQAVAEFCQREHLAVELVPLVDPYGPTLGEVEIDGLWVSQETKPGAELINRVRHERGLPSLPILECPMVLADNGQELHSDLIRAGVIDREGHVLADVFNNTLELTAEQRQAFSQPQGKLIALDGTFQPPQNGVAVVGDMSLETFINANWPYQLGIFDQVRSRQAVVSTVIDTLTVNATVENPAGQITTQLVMALQAAVSQPDHPTHLRVIGEEDLAAVALVLLLPLGWHIYYGQPHQGIVDLVVTEASKAAVRQILG